MLYILIARSLRGLLDEVIKIPSGTTFYMRLLMLGLLLISLATVLQVRFTLTEHAKFMEYVWKITSGLESQFSFICMFLFGYAVLITILVAALKKRND